MKRYFYRFTTFPAIAEELTGMKVSQKGDFYGVMLPESLRTQFGTRAHRLYPFGYLMVLPGQIPLPPFSEVSDDPDWEPELIF